MLNETGTQCNATSKSTGNQCKNPAVNGSSKCRLHGGKSLKGAEHPNFKHGGFSEHFPKRLLEIYDNIEDDLEHSLLSRNIKVREMFLREKLESLDEAPESKVVWAALRVLVDDMEKAFENDNLGMVKIGLMTLDRIVNERQAYHMAVDEIRSDLNEQRKDKQALSAIEYKGENAVPVTELMTFVSAIMNLISETVSSANERNRIYNAIDRLTRAEESHSNEFVTIEAGRK